MADYFDRLAARAHGDGVTAGPPARAILDSYPGGVYGAGEHAVAADKEVLAVSDAVKADHALDATGRRASPGRGIARAAHPPRAPSREAEVKPPVWQHTPQPAKARPAVQEDRGVMPPPRQSFQDFWAPTGPAIQMRARTLRPGPIPSSPDRTETVTTPPAATLNARSSALAVPENASSAPNDERRERLPDGGRSRGGPASPGDIPLASPVPSAPQPSQTIIRVSIGRVEVRATVPGAAPPHPTRTAPTQPRLTLESYLERAGERRKR